MTDSRPRPKYGEYAPIGAAEPAAAPEPFVATQAVESSPLAPDAQQARRRTWDIALTTGLILVGVFDVVTSFSRFADLASVLRGMYADQGFGEFTSDALANDMGFAMNVTRIVLLVAAIGFGLWRLGHNKLAFWVPIAAGVLAFIVISVCLLVVVLIDPALAEYAAQQSATP